MEFKIDGITIEFNVSNMTEDVAKDYIKYAKEHKSESSDISKIIVFINGDEADITIEYIQDKPKIERIRRITGYLTTAVDSWNNAKRAEESERVHHF